MIGDALVFLKDQLNTYIKSGWTSAETFPDPVSFVDGDKLDPLTFNLDAISLLLLNIEEDNLLRPDDLYRQIAADGSSQAIQPEIRLNLHVLFVARYKSYPRALENLSLVIQFFQGHRMYKNPGTVGLSDKIDQLGLELVTLHFSEQNEVWNALRASYHPSVLYRIRMIAFRDQYPVAETTLQEVEIHLTQK